MVVCELQTETWSLQGRNVTVKWFCEYGMKCSWSLFNLDSWKIFFFHPQFDFLKKYIPSIAYAFSFSSLVLFALEGIHGLSRCNSGNTTLGIQQREIFWPDVPMSSYKAVFPLQKEALSLVSAVIFILSCCGAPFGIQLVGGANLLVRSVRVIRLVITSTLFNNEIKTGTEGNVLILKIRHWYCY